MLYTFLQYAKSALLRGIFQRCSVAKLHCQTLNFKRISCYPGKEISFTSVVIRSADTTRRRCKLCVIKNTQLSRRLSAVCRRTFDILSE